jgi:hypothetical protein
MRMTVSHLLALARLPLNLVDAFVDRVLRESLTVREVRDAISERLRRALKQRNGVDN